MIEMRAYIEIRDVITREGLWDPDPDGPGCYTDVTITLLGITK